MGTTSGVERHVLHYNEPLLRSAVKAFWVRVVGWKFFVAVTIMIAALSRLIAHGDFSWFLGLLLVALILAVAGAGAVYYTQLRHTLGRFRSMKTPEAVLEIGASTLRYIADTGTLEVPWTGIKNVWRFKEFWLVFLAPAQFLTLPTSDLSPEVLDTIADRVRASGGKVG